MNQQNEFGFQSFKLWATYTIVALNTLVLLASHFSDFSGNGVEEFFVEQGALHPLLVWKGEIWRLFSAMFLHGSFFHYALNSFVLLQIGRMLEPVIGSMRLILVYFIAGVAGFSFSLLSDSGISLGSSGAVFGLVGALLGAQLNLSKERLDRKLLRTLVFFIGMNFVFGFGVNLFFPEFVRVDNAAHVGGLVFGLIFGFGLMAEFSRFRRYSMPVLVFSLGGFFSIVSLSIKPEFMSRYHEIMAIDGLVTKEFDASLRHSQWLSLHAGGFFSNIMDFHLAANQHEGSLAYELAKQALQNWPQRDFLGFWKAATFERKLSLLNLGAPLFADEKGNAALCEVLVDAGATELEILNNCAWLRLASRDDNVRDNEKGLRLALKAAGTSENIPAEVLHTLAQAYWRTGRLIEAVHTIDRAMTSKNIVLFKIFMEQKREIEFELTAGSALKAQS